MDLPTVPTVQRRAEEVADKIVRHSPNPTLVSMVAVTKGFDVELARRALQAGLVDLGENYAQDVVAKNRELATDGLEHTPRWHFIGGLQRNKVKTLAGVVSLWQTIDRQALVDELAKRAPGARMLVQVNTTGENAKSGCDPTETPALVDAARSAGLTVEGLMTVGPTDTSIDPRAAFAQLRQWAERCEVPQLSMGMSNDFELALEEGATIIRLGSALFGSRPSR